MNTMFTHIQHELGNILDITSSFLLNESRQNRKGHLPFKMSAQKSLTLYLSVWKFPKCVCLVHGLMLCNILQQHSWA